MATFERFQNPVVNDTVNLRLFSYNSNNRADITAIDSVEIYNLEEETPRLIDTLTNVSKVEVGQYLLSIDLVGPKYTIGKYNDVWHVQFGTQAASITNEFEILPDLWYTTTAPMIYNFDFKFMPNRIRLGSKIFLIIQFRPNVPHASDMERYYTNLAIAAPLKIYIEQSDCMPCAPKEEDLRVVVDGEMVEYREKCAGYYFLDTTELDKGIYEVWFELSLGESVYVSEKNNLQIF